MDTDKAISTQPAPFIATPVMGGKEERISVHLLTQPLFRKSSIKLNQ